MPASHQGCFTLMALDKWHPGKMTRLQVPNPQSGTPDGDNPAGGTAGPNPFRSTADPVTGEFFPTTVF